VENLDIGVVLIGHRGKQNCSRQKIDKLESQSVELRGESMDL
jgi:hypothetical protein